MGIIMQKIALSAWLSFIMATPAFAQQAGNPQTYGSWRFETASGIAGTVTLGSNICQYTLVTSFSNSVAYCQMAWNSSSRSLSIFGSRAVVSTTVPDYQPERSVVVNGGSAQPLVVFQLDEVTSRAMKGHIIGVGDNAHVTLEKH